MTRVANPAFFSAIVKMPFGAIGIRTDSRVVHELAYLPSHYAESPPSNELSKQVVLQIEHYLQEAHFSFELPLAESGTVFQRRIAQLIAEIPAGSVRTYGTIARKAHSSARAIGQACGANQFPLIIPCHRVVAVRGLGGFARQQETGSFHTSVKRWLLLHEGWCENGQQ